MNCEQMREQLPLLIYGDLNAAEEREATRHLAHCPACRHERETLLATKQLLDVAAVPEVAIDLPAIHAVALAVQARSVRRCKRFALAAGALAAGLLALLLIRPDVRIGEGQLVVRWGPGPEQPRAGVLATQLGVDADLEERIRLLNSLVHSLQKQVDGNDQQNRKDLDYVLICLELLRIQSQQQLDETRRDVGVLHTAQFGKRD